jgi:hypothetical protein
MHLENGKRYLMLAGLGPFKMCIVFVFDVVYDGIVLPSRSIAVVLRLLEMFAAKAHACLLQRRTRCVVRQPIRQNLPAG